MLCTYMPNASYDEKKRLSINWLLHGTRHGICSNHGIEEMNWIQATVIFGPILVLLVAFWKDIK